MKFEVLGNASTQFYCVNDIQDVIDGKRPENPEKLWMDAGNFSQGLGNGAIKDINALGESVIVNGVAYTKSADQSAADYYKLAANEKFMTSWVFMLSKEAQPTHKITYENGDKIFTLSEIYEIIYDKIRKPFVIAGVVQFAELKGSAIAKAPIDGKNIFDHKDVYYPYKADLKNVPAVVVGVAADIAEIKDDKLNSAMKKVVYYNPLEAGESNLTTHEHVLILNKNVDVIEKVTQADASDVQHLFTESTISNFCLNIYIINEIKML